MTFFFNPNEIKNSKSPIFITDPCKICGLYKHCLSPNIKPFGKFKKKIFVLGEAPGAREDEQDKGFVGKAGKLLKNALNENNIDFDYDCLRDNVIKCRPENNKFPDDKVQYCYDKLEQNLSDKKPLLIMCFGLKAIRRILETDVLPSEISNMNGTVFPSIKYNCWISCHYHPAYILRADSDNSYLENIFINDIAKALPYLNKQLPQQLLSSGENIVLEDNDAIELLKELTDRPDKIIAIDFETFPLSPFSNESEILCMSLSDNYMIGYCIPIDMKNLQLILAIQSLLFSKTKFVCHNGKFESIWAKKRFGTYIENRYWDTLLTAHIFDSRPNTKSLAFQSFLATGEEYKGMVDVKNIKNVDKPTLYNYNAYDSRFTKYIYLQQKQKVLEEDLKDPVKFFKKGDEALARLEVNGIKIDKKAFFEYKDNIINNEHKKSLLEINSNDVVQSFNKKYEYEFDINKNEHLKKLFFEIAELEPLSMTEKGNAQVNEDLFKFYEDDITVGTLCKSILRFKALNKIKTTYINAIETYVDTNWILHPTYNLWTTRTFRSSCDSPNLQNIPKRDEAQVEFRKIFIPRFDILLDADHKGSEVVIQAMLANDKNLIKQLKNGLDPHRHWASRLYEKSEKDITKLERYNAKNMFVFPLIYGSWYKSIAPNMKLKESHVKNCQNEFFDEYDGIAKYQRDKIIEYEKYGYVTTPLGFRRGGLLSRNQIINTPIQATSFHYLLDTLIKYVLIICNEYDVTSLPVLQIHDDIIFDTKYEERDFLINIINELTQNKPYFSFVKDISINVEYSEGTNWMDMKEIA